MECFSSLKNTPAVLSVIIPVYNVEDYVVETLNSLRGLRGLDAEIIVVDDGSTDTTLTQVKTWAEDSDLAVLILSKANEGPAIARNIAINKARGDFIAFLDGDDIALSYLYKEVVGIMQTHDVDYCGFRALSFDHSSQSPHPFPDYAVWEKIMGDTEFKIVTPHQEPRLGRLETNSMIRVYRKDFLINNKIMFAENLFLEDVPFSVKCLLNARKVALLNKTILLYRINRPGQETLTFGKRRHDILKIIASLIPEYVKRQVPDEVWANLVCQLIRLNVWCAENCAHEDKAEFINRSVVLFSKIPASVIELYINSYSYNKWEATICQAFIDRNISVLKLSADGALPIDGSLATPPLCFVGYG